MSPVISAKWLTQHLEDDNLVIADCRFSLHAPNLGQQQYDRAHIPGAVYFDLDRDLSGPVQTHGGRHPLPNLDKLAAQFSAAGIGSGERPADSPNSPNSPNSPTTVVAYDDSQFAFAARLWWLLRYLGHDRVFVLDGGFAEWQAAGYPVTDRTTKPSPRSFVPQVRSQYIVNYQTVLEQCRLPSVTLIDSREGDRYRGEREPTDPVAGHIPGAVNYFWKDVSDERGRLRLPAYHQQRWSAIADEVIVYCGSGVTACANLLSLEVAGRSNAKLYVGSWSDWCSYPDSPKITPDTAQSESQQNC
jgi:thiosulfate/3-mercaptopyruvate sulfurtransferase